MSERERLTPERLAELRRIAEAATPGPWRISDGRYDDVPADRFVIASAERDHIAETTQGGSFTDEDLANAHHIATFDPPTVLALLDRIKALEYMVSWYSSRRLSGGIEAGEGIGGE